MMMMMTTTTTMIKMTLKVTTKHVMQSIMRRSNVNEC